MRIAYLDCFSGMSGDMFLGALIDAGVPARVLEETVAALAIGATLEISRVSRNGISATKVDVFVNGEKELPREVFLQQQAQRERDLAHTHADEPRGRHLHADAEQSDHSPTHNLSPTHNHAPTHNHEPVNDERLMHDHHHATHHDHDHGKPHAHGRGLSEIKQIIAGSAISAGAKKTATAIFQALGEAEAKIHDKNIESIHFHEVGAVDAMVDIVCAAVGAEWLGVDQWVCSPLNVGSGTVKCAHGTLPVPAPATVELLKGAPVYSSGLTVELVTPTGAAIVKTLAKSFGPIPAMVVDKAGYGAGTRDFPDHANVVRLTVGEAREVRPSQAASTPHEIADSSYFETRVEEETIAVLEANLDDLNPQIFGYVFDRLLEEGALDVFGVPVQMKKNRPGMLLTVLCRTQDAASLSSILFAETTTLGVRRREEKRQVLGRKWIPVPTKWGEVRMKVASMNGAVKNCAPEFEDCRRIAREHGIPLKEVMQEAMRVYGGDFPVERLEDEVG